MPVKIPDGLPAVRILETENVVVIPEQQAFKQDIRPLQIAILNLMPIKTVAETQLLRLLSNSPLQVSVTFVRLNSYESKNTSAEYLERFYRKFDQIRNERFDCLIITGAPVETLPFKEVEYWDELRGIMDWSCTHVYSSFHICWGAQAGLFHHYGVPKHPLPEKRFGVYKHSVADPSNALVRGFDNSYPAPHSRYTETRTEDIKKVPSLCVLSESEEAGLYLVASSDNRLVFVTGHPEYDDLTLKDEYERDRAKGLSTALPVNYFPQNKQSERPLVSWRAHASLLFLNWLNEVYQHAPFDLRELKAALK